ncbi:MAG: DUF4258 domain-containing protein [Chloroflexi bacterium]|nr:DUF4258 domain-containing protein [Chloroflexota bacterium]
MYERILKQMQDKIRARQYVATIHAEEEMVEDALSIFDVESAVLTGKIVERQKDEHPDQWKYVVKGEALSGAEVYVVGRISLTEKLIIITVFRA